MQSTSLRNLEEVQTKSCNGASPLPTLILGEYQEMKLNIFHNMRGIANEYFVSNGDKVLFKIPNFVGKILMLFFDGTTAM